MTMAFPVSGMHSRENVRLVTALLERFGASVSLSQAQTRSPDPEFSVTSAEVLPALTEFLFSSLGCSFGGLIAEERDDQWELRYVFLTRREGLINFVLRLPLATHAVPSISTVIHAADWYEREVEDMFGLEFQQHPRLGDFILHDQVWQEGLAPMRKRFDASQTHLQRRPKEDWHPVLVVQDPGAFAMPVGPVYEGGVGESVHFLLETVGEDVIRAVPRLFYNYRAVEKIAEGKSVCEALLLAERFSAKSAFAHSLAFCQAIERISGQEIPARASTLRVVLAELERLRHHAGAIAAICQSTALSVSEAQAAIIEEQLLRASCVFAGHRYLFGLNTPGGLRRDFGPDESMALLAAVDAASRQLQKLETRLRYSSSFLDRLEDVGIIPPEKARELDLFGPLARASGLSRDFRQRNPYCRYEKFNFQVPCEKEGDGFARLRVLFTEAQQSASLIRQAVKSLEPGEICYSLREFGQGMAFGLVEAPIGAALHWVRLDSDQKIERYRIMTPSFRNWLGLHVAVEDFAFQDFPIILATFGLSATECDR